MTLEHVLRRAASEYGVEPPELVILDRDEWYGEPPNDGGYYTFHRGHFLTPGETHTGSFRVGNPEYTADGPTILLFAPQGTDRDTLMHEFSHYIEWLSEGEAYHDRAERNVDSYERDVKERTNDFMF
jgi:hypothetical protein